MDVNQTVSRTAFGVLLIAFAGMVGCCWFQQQTINELQRAIGYQNGTISSQQLAIIRLQQQR